MNDSQSVSTENCTLGQQSHTSYMQKFNSHRSISKNKHQVDLIVCERGRTICEGRFEKRKKRQSETSRIPPCFRGSVLRSGERESRDGAAGSGLFCCSHTHSGMHRFEKSCLSAGVRWWGSRVYTNSPRRMSPTQKLLCVYFPPRFWCPVTLKEKKKVDHFLFFLPKVHEGLNI